MNQHITPMGGRSPAVRAGSYGPLGPVEQYYSETEQQPGIFDLQTIWRVIWDRKLLVLAAAGLGVALAVVLSLLQTPLYRSTASLELNPPTIPILTNNDDELVAPATDAEFLSTQYSLMKSEALAARVVEDLNLLGKPGADSGGDQEQRLERMAAEVSDNLQVTPVTASRVVELTYTSANPREAARVVNGFANAFIKSTLERRYESAASARNFLQERLTTVRADLNEAERELNEYARANGIITIGSEGDGESDVDSLQGASLVALNDALAQAQQRRIAAETRYRNLGSASEVNQRTEALRQEKARLDAEYRQKSAIYQPSYPEMVQLRERIAGLDEAIGREERAVSSSRASTLRSEYRAAAAEEASLQGRVNGLKGSVMDLSKRSIQLGILQREVDTARSLYDALLERYNEIGVTGGITTPQASMIDTGKVPSAPYSPDIPRNVVLGGLLGIFLGLVSAFVMFQITDRISTPDDVRDKLRLPLLGVIPKTKRKEELADALADRKSAISEAYASLATTLQFTTNEGIPPVLLITSTIAEEGKSTTSFVIASLLAHHGKRVLLIDADLRKPSFAVEESTTTGFSPLVIGGGDLERHIIKTSEDKLWLMPSGPIPANPVQIINSDRAAGIISQAREMFDVVIVDAPPTYGFADAPLLAAMCDGVLVLFESGKTRRRPATEVIERLRTAGANIIGAALTKYRFEASEYGYRYYEAYGEKQQAAMREKLALVEAEERSAA